MQPKDINGKKIGQIETFGYDRPKTPEVQEETESAPIEILDTLSVRFKDLIVSISAEESGVLYGRTHAESLKYCADILLRAAGENGLMDQIDTPIAIHETLQFDYGWNPVKIFEFLRKWKRNMYLKQIGEENRTEENLEELEKAMGIMNKSKANDAIREDIEEQVKVPDPIPAPTEVYIKPEPGMEGTQIFSRDSFNPEEINNINVEKSLNGETFTERSIPVSKIIVATAEVVEEKKVAKKPKK